MGLGRGGKALTLQLQFPFRFPFAQQDWGLPPFRVNPSPHCVLCAVCVYLPNLLDHPPHSWLNRAIEKSGRQAGSQAVRRAEI